MRGFKKVLISFLMLCLVLSQSVFVFADGVSSAEALATLVNFASNDVGSASLSKGSIFYSGVGWDYKDKTYACKNGGYKIYRELAVDNTQHPINENNLSQLTTGAKNEFLQDYYNAGQKVLDWGNENPSYGINQEVGTNWLNQVQNTSGVGSQLMTTLMSQTKPDYVTANRIYEPFSGTVGTILGIVAILIMAFLAITMVLDLAYIAIPTFQLFIDGDGGGQGGGKKKSFISQEAMDAVQGAASGGGQGGQGDSSKLAVGIYFKKRVLMLVVLGICLLYLVSGNIFAFVGWLIDLLSGFLGF